MTNAEAIAVALGIQADIDQRIADGIIPPRPEGEAFGAWFSENISCSRCRYGVRQLGSVWCPRCAMNVERSAHKEARFIGMLDKMAEGTMQRMREALRARFTPEQITKLRDDFMTAYPSMTSYLTLEEVEDEIAKLPSGAKLLVNIDVLDAQGVPQPHSTVEITQPKRGRKARDIE